MMKGKEEIEWYSGDKCLPAEDFGTFPIMHTFIFIIFVGELHHNVELRGLQFFTPA